MKTLSPAHIIDTALGFRAAKTLLSAVELDLFTTLGDHAMTGEDLRVALQLHLRANPDFFDALVALRLLERDGEGPHARYHNTAETRFFLDRTSPGFIGAGFENTNARLYRFWGDLTEALKTGRPQSEIKHTGVSMFDELYRDPQRLEQFLEAMAAYSAARGAALAEKFGWARYGTLCDVGGASGQLAMSVARRHPHLRCMTADLPVVTPIAARKIAAAGLAERVTAQGLDFFADPLPQADVITMGSILHDWNLDKKLHLIRAAYEALRPGGALIAIEVLIDDARRENVFGLLNSLNMLVAFGDGFEFTGADFAAWCRSVGFREIEIMPLTGRASAAIAYK